VNPDGSIPLDSSEEMSGVESTNPFVNNILYIAILVVSLLILIIVVIARFVAIRYKEKLKLKL